MREILTQEQIERLEGRINELVEALNDYGYGGYFDAVFEGIINQLDEEIDELICDMED